MIIHGNRLTAEERAQGLAYARAWRIANKPYFDAIYGDETARQTCPTCDGHGTIARKVQAA